MNSLRLEHKVIFDKFFKLKSRCLSSRSFANIFICNGTFDIFWEIIDKNLCIFMKDSVGCFMYLPPLGGLQRKNVLDKCFCVMDKFNNGSGVSRIENIAEDEIGFYRDAGLRCRKKDGEYIYLTEELCSLKGCSYRKKRSPRNYFLKNYNFRVEPFSSRHRDGCRALYKRWAKNRSETYGGRIFRQMLDDSYVTLSSALAHYNDLGLQGKVVFVQGRVAGFSIGYALSEDTFCIIFEIAELEIKGLPQFLFWNFSQEQREFRYINAMDDSGLKNLRKVKLSYRPHRIEPVFIASRN